MKNIRLILVLLLGTLSACGGEPFGPELFAAYGSAAGEAGQASLGTPDGPDGKAGAGDAPNAAGAGGSLAGSAGAPARGGSSGAGGASGALSVAGAPQGGALGSAGAGGAPAPPAPPCSPSTIVSGKVKLALGTIAQCLRTTADIDYLACSNWDGREIRVNGVLESCWVKFPAAPAIGGWNYIEIEPGDNAMASLDWSVI